MPAYNPCFVKRVDAKPPIFKECTQYTDQKENQIFLIYKEILNGAVAKSYMTNATAPSYMGKCFLRIFSYTVYTVLGSPSSYVTICIVQCPR